MRAKNFPIRHNENGGCSIAAMPVWPQLPSIRSGYILKEANISIKKASRMAI